MPVRKPGRLIRFYRLQARSFAGPIYQTRNPAHVARFFEDLKGPELSRIRAIRNALDQEEFISTRNPIYRPILLIFSSSRYGTREQQFVTRQNRETEGKRAFAWVADSGEYGEKEREREKRGMAGRSRKNEWRRMEAAPRKIIVL